MFIPHRHHLHHWNPATVRVERVGTSPVDERGAGDDACAFGHLDTIEPYARAFKPEPSGPRLDWLAVRRRIADGHPAEPQRRRVWAVEMKLAR